MDKETTIPNTHRRQAIERRCRVERRLAEGALEHYPGLRGARLELLRQRFVQVFRVFSPRGQFTLRLYDIPKPGSQALSTSAALRTLAELRSPEVLRSQLLWLSALGRETDLVAPEPVPTKDGSLLGHVSTHDLTKERSLLRWLRCPLRLPGDEGFERGLRAAASGMSRNFALLSWVAGKHKTSDDLELEDASLIGSYVAQLHHHAEGYEVPEGAALPRWDWRWPLGEGALLWSKGASFYSTSDMEAFRMASQRVREVLQELGEGSEVFGLIHRDLTLDNLLFDAGTVGAVDFDLCGLGYYLFDVHTVRTSLKAGYGGRLEPLWEAFVEGYQRERPLPEDLQRHLITFEVMQKVAAVNRQLALLSSGDADAHSRSPDFLANVASWLRHLLRRWGTYAASSPYALSELSYVVRDLAIL
jgi:Ser/Thr protein kinase RdoA (MazF antagonist)